MFWPARVSVPWKGWSPDDHEVTIIALGLTGQETADDLRRLADIFDTTERLYGGAGHGVAFEDLLVQATGGDEGPLADYDTSAEPKHAPSRRALAERLHAAGWRGRETGKSPEDAARMLAGT